MTVWAARLRAWHVPSALGTFVLSNLSAYEVVVYAGRVTPALIAAGAAVPGLVPQYQAVGAWVDGSLSGFGLVRYRAGERRAGVAALVILAHHGERGRSPGQPDGTELNACTELLYAAGAEAAGQGAVSLLARVPDGSPFALAFAETGFVVAVREHAYRLQPAPVPAPAQIRDLRRQAPVDAWDILQLYRAITPAAVQQAESPSPQQWETAPSGLPWPARAVAACERYVVPGPHGLDAWLEILTNAGGGHRLALMVHPRASELVGPIIQFALWRLSDFPARPVRVVVRDHETQLAAGLESAGFVRGGCELLMVKHMAIRIPSEVPGVAFERATGQTGRG